MIVMTVQESESVTILRTFDCEHRIRIWVTGQHTLASGIKGSTICFIPTPLRKIRNGSILVINSHIVERRRMTSVKKLQHFKLYLYLVAIL